MHRVLPLRSSPAFWSGFPIVVIMWLMYGSFYAQFTPARYWDAVISIPTNALWLGVPLAAGAAACEASRVRSLRLTSQTVPVVSSARIAFAHVAPILAAVAVGFLTILGWDVARAGVPLTGSPNLVILLAAGATVVIGVAMGWTLGRLLPLVFALPLSVLLEFAWITYPRSDGFTYALRHVSGFGLYECCQSFGEIAAWQALVAPLLVAIPLVALALVATSPIARTVVHRFVVLVGVGLACVASFAVAASLVSSLGPFPTAPRPSSDLQCIGDSLAVCGWPEQLAASDANLLLTTLERAHASASSQGIELPTLLVSRADPDESRPTTVLNFSGAVQPDDLILAYARSVVEGEYCPTKLVDAESQDAMDRAMYGLAVAMGAIPKNVLPPVYETGPYGEEPAQVDPSQISDELGLGSPASAAEFFTSWLAEQSPCLTTEGTSK